MFAHDVIVIWIALILWHKKFWISMKNIAKKYKWICEYDNYIEDEDNEEEISKQLFDRIALENFSNKCIFFIDTNTGKRIPGIIKSEREQDGTKDNSCEITRIDYDQNLNVYYFNKAKSLIKVYNKNLEFMFKVRYSKKYKTLGFTNIDSVVFNEKLGKDFTMEFNEY
jgi:hypothetical protein